MEMKLPRRAAPLLSLVLLAATCVVGLPSRPVGASPVVLDQTWGIAGSTNDTAAVLSPGLQGRVFLVDGATGGLSVRRLDDTGEPDSAWGGDGDVTVSLPSPIDDYFPLAAAGLQTGGLLVLAGSYSSSDVVLVRLLESGTLDSAGFGTGGVAPVSLPGLGTFDPSLTVSSFGEIFLSTRALTCSGWTCSYSGAVGRLTSAGGLDAAFDGDGWWTTSGYAPAVVGARPDGKVLIHEDSSSSSVSGRVRRLLPSGAVDSTFPSLQVPYGVRVFMSADDRLLVVHQEWTWSPEASEGQWEATLTYFTPDGSADVTRPNQTLLGTEAVRPLGDLDEVVGGRSGALYYVRTELDTDGVAPAAAGRLTSSGRRDGSFGVNGFAALPGGRALETQLRMVLNDRG